MLLPATYLAFKRAVVFRFMVWLGDSFLGLSHPTRSRRPIGRKLWELDGHALLNTCEACIAAHQGPLPMQPALGEMFGVHATLGNIRKGAAARMLANHQLRTDWHAQTFAWHVP